MALTLVTSRYSLRYVRKKRTNPTKKAPGKTVTTNYLIGNSKGSEVGKAKSTALTQIPQTHGGALNSGGTPGNRSGPGRTPNELRALFRKPLAQLLPVVQGIAEAKHTQEVTCPHCEEKHEVETFAKVKEKLAAVDLLSRYGIGTRQEVEHKGHVSLHVDTETQPE